MELIKFIQSFSNPFLDKLFIGITMLGEEYFSILLLVIIYWCINKRFGYKLGFTLILSLVFNGIIKNIFKAARPIGEKGIRTLRKSTATGYSFPSGHTQNTTVLWTAIMTELKKRWCIIVGTIIIFLVAVSRLYLGVHWPKDVIGGVIFGIISLFISNYIFKYIENSKNKKIIGVIVIIPLIGIMFFKGTDYAKAVGVINGFILGYIIEDTYIDFDVKSKVWKQIVKVILGISVVIFIKIILKRVLPINKISDFIRYTVIGFWCVAGAPYLFKELNL